MFLLVTLSAAISARADYETLNAFVAFGGGFGMGGKLYTSSDQASGSTATTYKDRFFNYGSGFKFDLGCQYFVMEDVALQPSFSYSVAPTFKYHTTTSVLNDNWEVSRHLFGLKLAVVPRFEVLDLIDMYAGVGLGFFWNVSHFERTTTVPTLTVVQNAEGSNVSLPTIGFNGMLGADYPLTDKFTFFGELGFEQMRFKLKKRVVDQSTITLMPEGTTFYSKNDSQNLDPEEIPGSNFQIRVGIRYAISTR
jgi:opacity protein-like surface antigen